MLLKPTQFFAILCLQLLWGSAIWAATAGSETDVDAEMAAARTKALKTFKEQVAPFVTNYCARCHGEKKKKAGLTFEYAVKNPGLPTFRTLWKRALTNIKTHDMPPPEEKQPTDQERQVVLDWLGGMKHLSPKDPGQFVIRRLNKVEYGNTLHDLFGVDAQITHELPDEVFGAGYTNSFSPLLMEQYLMVANEVLNQISTPAGTSPTTVQLPLFVTAPGADPKESARKVAQTLARSAYRRPPTESEIQVLLQVFALATDKGKSYPDALRLMVKAILVSPQFLFITPDVPEKPAEVTAANNIVPLDDHQLAARLSYLLWATTPDAELSALADSGKLRDPKVLAEQTRRLLNNPRSRAVFDGFGAQWLGLDKLSGKTFDAEKFPQMTAPLRTAMYDEARLLFDSIVRENRSLTSFIDCDYTYLNGTLAAIYGMEGKVTGSEMRKVQLSNANRGGILTMPGILATSSFPNRTSAVNRGVWVLEQVLGEHVPPPPANVPALEKQDQHKVANLTLRQRTELHRTDAVCANCHKILDPIGFGLENFDAIGRWRDKDDSGGAIDATGELPGGLRFTTPKELKGIIAKRNEDFCRNLTGKFLAYALGHQLEGYDEIVVDQLSDAIAKDGYKMQTLIVSVVTSYPFTHRRLNTLGEKPNGK